MESNYQRIKRAKKAARTSNSHTFGLLYSILLLAATLLLSVHYCIDLHQSSHSGFKLEVLVLFLLAVAMFILIYLIGYLLQQRWPMIIGSSTRPTNRERLWGADGEQAGRASTAKSSELMVAGLNRSNSAGQLEDDSAPDNDLDDMHSDVKVFEGPEGMSLYLRIVLTVCFLAATMSQCFALADILSPAGNGSTVPVQIGCQLILYTTIFAVFIVFFFLQTFVIFKAHAVIIVKYEPLAKIGFSHLAVANLCLYLATTVTTLYHVHYSWTDSERKTSPKNATEIFGGCRVFNKNSLVAQSHQLFYPLTCIYFLLSAAVFAKINDRIGLNRKIMGDASLRAAVKSKVLTQSLRSVRCHRSHKGLFLGMFVLMVVSVAAVVTFLFSSTGHIRSDTSKLHFGLSLGYLVCSCVILIILLLVVFVTLGRFRRLQFSPPPYTAGRSHIDHLLLFSAFVQFAHMASDVLQALDNFGRVGELHSKHLLYATEHEVVVLSGLFLGRHALQVLLLLGQTQLCLCGRRRRCASEEESRQRPAREALTFLIVANFSLLVLNGCSWRHNDLYLWPALQPAPADRLLASIVQTIAAPLGVLYPALSSAYFISMWTAVYQP